MLRAWNFTKNKLGQDALIKISKKFSEQVFMNGTEQILLIVALTVGWTNGYRLKWFYLYLL